MARKRLIAKIPDRYMTMSYKLFISEDANSKINIKQDDDLICVHLRDELCSWLKNNCKGNWKIVIPSWQIEFENKEDYVSYCLNWV